MNPKNSFSLWKSFLLWSFNSVKAIDRINIKLFFLSIELHIINENVWSEDQGREEKTITPIHSSAIDTIQQLEFGNECRGNPADDIMYLFA